MTSRGDERGNLERLASTLLAASEKLEAGELLAEEEVRSLRALRAAMPRETRPGAWPWALCAAAAVLLLGFLALSNLVGRQHRSSAAIALAMAPASGTRSASEWRSGDLFTLRVTLPEDLYLHVLHVDAAQHLDFVFPHHDSVTGAWSYLGYPSNRLPGGTPAAIPAPDFPLSLRIEGEGGGNEILLAFATRDQLGGEDLLGLRAELRRVEETQRERSSEAILGHLRQALAGRSAATGGLRYQVKPQAEKAR